jgi:hypothetical protein
MTSNNPFYGVLASMALWLLAGCNSGTSGPTQEDAHQVPPHKPAGFVEAVPALRDRLAEFQKNDSALDREARRKQVGEFKDIIQWLPELAAETDLRKADWDIVNAASKRMAARCDEIASRLVDRPADTDDASLPTLEHELDILDRLVERLSNTVAASGGRAPIP